MDKGPGLVCILAITASVLSASEALKIAAFNVEVFGQKKISKPDVVSILKQIVRRYDIVLIQEIRDKSGTAITTFTSTLNTDSDSEHVYELVVSERLGRTTSKEQYAFLYRPAVVEVVATYQYNDTEDEFEREPFSVLFRTTEGENEFFLMGIHVKPDDVFNELEALGPVFTVISEAYGSSRGAIMGDLNAGCSSLSQTRYEELSLVNDPDFVWLFGYDADTTTATSSCPYDRVIVHAALNSSVVENSAAVFNFTEAYSLTSTQAKNVSDHFPVEFQLQFQADIQATPTTTTSTLPPDSSLHTLPDTSLLLGLVTMATICLFLCQ